jgi:hypothetical protein
MGLGLGLGLVMATEELRLDRLEQLAESTLLIVRENSQAVAELRESNAQQGQELRENMAQQWQETRAGIDALAQMIDRHTKR